MKKHYDICGFGNALVDIEIDLTDADLATLHVEKGMMTLIDEDRLTTLLTHFPKSALHKKACGGSAANTIIGATQFGAKTFYQCKIANDELGRFYAEDLTQNNVPNNTKHCLKQPVTQPTGVCVVMITPDAERTMNSFLGVTATFSKNDIDTTAIQSSHYLYIEGYLAGSDIGCDAAIHAKKIAEESNTKTVLTFSDPSMVTYCKANLEKMLGTTGVDILFCNDTEATRFTQTTTLADAQSALLSRAKLVIITEGKDGASIATPSERIKIPGYPAKAIDTNGAGDLFAGAFLAELIQGKSLEQCGHTACKAAAKLVEHYGPRLTEI